jgi:hypothetical protein
MKRKMIWSLPLGPFMDFIFKDASSSFWCLTLKRVYFGYVRNSVYVLSVRCVLWFCGACLVRF